MGILGVMVNKD